MNTKPATDLDELARVWHADQGPGPDELIRQVQRATRMAGWKLLVEITISLMGLMAGLWLLSQGNILIGAATCAFSVIGLVIGWRTRIRTTRAPTDTVQAELSASLQHAQDQYKAVRSGLWVLTAALIFLLIILLQALTGAPLSSAKLSQLLLSVSGALLFMAINLAWLTVSLRRTQQRLFQLQQLYAELRDQCA